jgi:hypothetical protein
VAHESLKELSRHLIYNDLFGNGFNEFVNLDDYLLIKALKEALNAGLEDYIKEQMKATVT